MFVLTESDLSQLLKWFNQFYWPFLRIAGLLMIAPIVGDARVPVRIRIGLCLALTMVVFPSTAIIPDIEPISVDGILITGTQILIGVSIGFMIQLVFNAMVIGGESIATTMGLGFALMNDPSNGVQVPIVSQFYIIFVTLLFLSFNGHHALIELLAVSFIYFPVGEVITSNMIGHLVEWSVVLFNGALKVALPALAALLTVNLVMGVMTRSAPQLNIFSIGFPITMMVGFLVMLFTLPSVSVTFQLLIAQALDSVSNFLQVR